MSIESHSTRRMPADKLLAVEAKLDEVLKLLRAQTSETKLRDTAAWKFKNGLPMRTAEVALVLGMKRESVNQKASRGQIRRLGDGLYDSTEIKKLYDIA